jgi:arginine decarboxylase
MQWFQRDQYIENIARLINTGHKKHQLLITLKNLICCKVKSRINSKLEFVSPLKKSQSLNFIPQIRIGYKNIVPFYKRDQRK